MTPDPVSSLPNCQKCSAQANRLDARFCEYCGAELPRPVAAQPEPSRAGGASANLKGRFAALEAHSDWERLKAFAPVNAGMSGPLGTAFMGIFLVVWIGVGGIITMGFAATAGPLALFPLGIVSLGVITMVKGARRHRKFLNAPIIPHAALVVDERVAVSGGGKNSSASTHYHTTLEFPDGQRSEHATIPEAAAQACPGDVGMAYLRDNRLVHFERVPV